MAHLENVSDTTLLGLSALNLGKIFVVAAMRDGYIADVLSQQRSGSVASVESQQSHELEDATAVGEATLKMYRIFKKALKALYKRS